MPIKPENKARYPKNWKEIRASIQARANDKCEWCGVVNHAHINSKTRDICLPDEEGAIMVVCTTAHLDHTPENNNHNNLAFLCQKCHNNYDKGHRKQTIRDSRNVGQLRLNLC
ncbi:MAG: hypothetical protein HC896_00175 [Bacteroidales bacterium]|nr:hypothetical protein [Bacteroidales bacterium]